MLNAKDLEQLSEKGISQEKIEEQLSCFEKGFPFLEIEASASVEKGIKVIPAESQPAYMAAWDAYRQRTSVFLSLSRRRVLPVVCLRICLDSFLPTTMFLQQTLKRSFLPIFVNSHFIKH